MAKGEKRIESIKQALNKILEIGEVSSFFLLAKGPESRVAVADVTGEILGEMLHSAFESDTTFKVVMDACFAELTFKKLKGEETSVNLEELVKKYEAFTSNKSKIGKTMKDIFKL